MGLAASPGEWITEGGREEESKVCHYGYLVGRRLG